MIKFKEKKKLHLKNQQAAVFLLCVFGSLEGVGKKNDKESLFKNSYLYMQDIQAFNIKQSPTPRDTA